MKSSRQPQRNLPWQPVFFTAGKFPSAMSKIIWQIKSKPVSQLSKNQLAVIR
jgi:hypothetical protein